MGASGLFIIFQLNNCVRHLEGNICQYMTEEHDRVCIIVHQDVRQLFFNYCF